MKFSRLLNIIIIICCLVLVASYFVPTGISSSPVGRWTHDLDFGTFLSTLPGLLTDSHAIPALCGFLDDTFPYAVGVVVLLILALLRRYRVCTVILAIVSITWTASLTYGVIDNVGTSSELLQLWMIQRIVIILSFVIVIVLTLCRTPKATTVLAGAAFLAAVSVLGQSAFVIPLYLCGYAGFRAIDNVAAVAAAAVLFITLLVKRQRCGASEKVVSDESVAEIVLEKQEE